MNIVIKPLGAVFLFIAIAVLAVMAFRNSSSSTSTVSSSVGPPVVVSGTTPSRGAGTSPSASAAARGHSIYRDGVENGWQTQGWTSAKVVSFDDTTSPHSGTKAIRVSYTGFDGVKFHHAPLNTRPFDRVSFYVNGGDTGGQRIAVGAACSEKNASNSARLAALPRQKWVAVTIPLSKIGLANRPDMTSFWIQGGTDKPQAAVFIDEVRLLKPGEPSPSGASLALSR
jgi:hypothetical protein